jgi:two-component sensor histidine kinase
LATGPWNVVLADHSLPEFSATEALAVLQEFNLDLPFIIVSGEIGEEAAVALMKAGAHDYIPKAHLGRLIPAIEREIVDMRVRKEKADAEGIIRASLREKEILLKEIHHRVKNNLQLVTSLLNLQIQRIPDTTMRELIAATQRRIRSMALVHERLYHSPDLAVIDLAEYVQAMSGELHLACGRPGITITLAISHVPLGVDHAIPCGLILTELLTNSLKHGFPGEQSGEIRISVTPGSPGEYVLVLSDNGVGFPPEFDMRTSDTLGAQVIRSLVDQLDGSCEAVNEAGAKVSIRFSVVA